MTKMKNLGWKQCHCTTLLLSLRAFFLLSLRAERGNLTFLCHSEPSFNCHCERSVAISPSSAIPSPPLIVIASGAWQPRGETKPIPVEDIVYGIIVYKLQDC